MTWGRGDIAGRRMRECSRNAREHSGGGFSDRGEHDTRVEGQAKHAHAPRPTETKNIMMATWAMMLMLAKMHQMSLGDFCFNMIRYRDMDILLFDVPLKNEASLLVVVMKRPHALDERADRIADAACKMR